MVATRRSSTSQPPEQHGAEYTRSSSMSKRSRVVEYTEAGDDSNDEEFLTLKQKKTRSSSRLTEDRHSPHIHNGNSDEEFSSRRINGSATSRNSPPRKINDHKYPSVRHPQMDADLLKKKQRDNISHSRSLRSLGLDEEVSSCEEEDGIGALATTSRRRSASRESFPNMLLRRSSRNRKTIYSTLNVSTIEHAAMLPDEMDHVEHVSRKRSEKHQSRPIKPELRDLLIAQGKNPEEIADISQPDIYSSIKSRRRSRRPRRFFDEDEIIDPLPPEHDPHSDNSDAHEGVEDAGAKEEEDEEAEHEEEDEDDDDEDDDEDDDDEEEVNPRRKYSLRTKRAQPLRLVYEIQPQTRQPSRGIFDHLPTSPVHRRRHHARDVNVQHPASPYQQRQRRTNSQGASSNGSTSSDDDETKFERRKKKSMAKARNRCLPMNLTLNDLAKHGFSNERRKIGSSLADVDPMLVDKSVKFTSVGGHRKHVRALKEMVVFPLMYPEVFEKFNIHPPRGCLFYGPPGTGKTLMARALANECSTEGRKVAFFMRKGADCLSKWVGESERQLRLLFDQAYQMRPSIIFFDEIDGLAPVRSSRQDQIHSSIVSTLLGLMDGLDNRGEIIVIGATNRIDSIDPALRRPGRFDREFSFPLPDKKSRREILCIHTQKWLPALSDAFLDDLAEKTVGYCGADIMALCAESALFALRRRYPQIYSSNDKLKLDIDTISIQAQDFYKAMQNVVPTAQRSDVNPSHALHTSIRPLLLNTLRTVMVQLAKLFPLVHKKSKLLRDTQSQTATSAPLGDHSMHFSDSESEFEEDFTNEQGMLPLPPNGLSIPQSLLSGISSYAFRESTVFRPRLLLCGTQADGHTTHLAPAILHDIEGIPVHLLDIPALYGTSARTPEEACAQIFREARRTAPSIIYIPNAPMWWDSASATVHHTFESLLRTLPACAPVALIATADCLYEELPYSLSSIFYDEHQEVYSMTIPTVEERTLFFAPLFLQFAIKPPVNKLKKKQQATEVLEKAPAPPVADLTEKEVERLDHEEEATMRSLRLFLRDVLTRLAQDRRFKVFLKPVDINEVTDYIEVIDEPMDISSMMNKIDQHKYNNVASFVSDINLICSNALEYNPDHCAEDRAIRHRACLLKDIAHAIIQEDLDPNFERLCNEVIEARKKRNANPLKFAPAYFNVLPKPRRISQPENQVIDTDDKTPNSKTDDLHSNQSLSGPRRKRKRSSWASGVIRKAKKKAKIDDDTSEGDNALNDTIAIDDGGLDSADDADVTTDQVDDEDSNVANGDLAESDDARNNDVISRTSAGGDAEKEPDVRKEDNPEENLAPNHEEVNGVFKEEDDDSVDKDMSGSAEDEEQEDSEVEEDNKSEADKQSNHASDENQPPSPEVEDPVTEVDEVAMEVNEEEEDKTDEASGGNKAENVEGNNEENETNSIKEEDGKEFQTVCRMTLRSRTKSSNSEQTNEPSQPVIVIPPPPPLIVDEQKLKDLLQYTVQATSSLRIDELQRLYSVLIRCIHTHRQSYDKTQLVHDLTIEVTSYVRHASNSNVA